MTLRTAADLKVLISELKSKIVDENYTKNKYQLILQLAQLENEQSLAEALEKTLEPQNSASVQKPKFFPVKAESFFKNELFSDQSESEVSKLHKGETIVVVVDKKQNHNFVLRKTPMIQYYIGVLSNANLALKALEFLSVASEGTKLKVAAEAAEAEAEAEAEAAEAEAEAAYRRAAEAEAAEAEAAEAAEAEAAEAAYRRAAEAAEAAAVYQGAAASYQGVEAYQGIAFQRAEVAAEHILNIVSEGIVTAWEKVKQKKEINSDLYLSPLRQEDMRFIMNAAINLGGIGKKREEFIVKLQEAGVAEGDHEKMFRTAKLFSATFQKSMEEQGVLTGNPKATQIVGMRLKRLEPAIAITALEKASDYIRRDYEVDPGDFPGTSQSSASTTSISASTEFRNIGSSVQLISTATETISPVATPTPTISPVVVVPEATETETISPVVPEATATLTPTISPVVPEATETETETISPVVPEATATETGTGTGGDSSENEVPPTGTNEDDDSSVSSSLSQTGTGGDSSENEVPPTGTNEDDGSSVSSSLSQTGTGGDSSENEVPPTGTNEDYASEEEVGLTFEEVYPNTESILTEVEPVVGNGVEPEPVVGNGVEPEPEPEVHIDQIYTAEETIITSEGENNNKGNDVSSATHTSEGENNVLPSTITRNRSNIESKFLTGLVPGSGTNNR